MNCIIIDDEATARLIIRQLCTNVPILNVLAEFSNAMEAIKYLNQNEVDLIFLDIHMPDFTGFDFVDTIKNPPKVLLTTSDTKCAIQAFGYNCIVDYLVKPITLQRFQKAIDRVVAKKLSAPAEALSNQLEATSGNDLFINIDRRLIKVDIPSIYLVEAKGDYIHIKTEDKNYTVHSALKKIEEKLPTNLFVRIHRSYIININKIIDIEDNSVLIKKDIIPVSRSNRPELMKRINLL